MIVRIQKRESPYVMLDKTALNDERLSFRAKGLHAYLLSRPDNWRVNVRQLSGVSKEGRDAVATALNELIDLGYADRLQEQGENGKFCQIGYVIYETPQLANNLPCPENPYTVKQSKQPRPEKPYPEKPYPENPQLLNKEYTNTLSLGGEREKFSLSAVEAVFEELAPSLAAKKEEAKKLYDYYASKGWVTSSNVPVTNLRALVSNWLTRKREFEARGRGRRQPRSGSGAKDRAEAAVRGAEELDKSKLPDNFNPFE